MSVSSILNCLKGFDAVYHGYRGPMHGKHRHYHLALTAKVHVKLDDG